MKDVDITKAADLYNARFNQHGRGVQAVGWGSEESQNLRFEVLFRGLDLAGKTILDVGCGLADLIPFLAKRTDGNFQYIGIDVAEKFIEDARIAFGKSGREFHVGDIFSVIVPQVDIAVLSGALSLKVSGVESYAYETMKRMFDLSRKASCLNFLSTYVDYELNKNQHYQPETVFGWAKRLSKRVNLIHDYPLYEFTIQMIR